MLLPRSNPAAVNNLDVKLLKSGKGFVEDVKVADRIAIKINNHSSYVSLVEQEVDDLIVMLTYYRREVFGDA